MRTTIYALLLTAVLSTGIANFPLLMLVQAQSEIQETPGEISIRLPIIQGEPSEATSPIPSEDGLVFGLLGTLQVAQGQSFSTYLIVGDPNSGDRRVGLVGETPDIEARITTLRDQQPNSRVKVWGTFFSSGVDTIDPQVVASDIIPADETAPGVALPLSVIKFDMVNLRQGPGNRFAHAGQATRNEACVIVNRNPLETWYFIDCPGNIAGWIDRRLVDVHGNTDHIPVADESTAVLPPSATPTPVPTPMPGPTAIPTPDLPPTDQWRGEYFANPQLAQPAQLQQNTGDINFNWGAGSPGPGIPNDGFSARFDRTFDFGYGYYRFVARADDGVRVYLDGQPIIDEWYGATDKAFIVGRTLSGRHVIMVEYYEASGDANLKLEIDFRGSDPQWTTSYYGGVELAGVPVLDQREAVGDSPLDYNWGGSSPVPGLLSNDFWSARWVGKFKFNNGNYVFYVNADDGVRVFLNDTRIIDDWRDGYREVKNTFIGVGEDEHTIRVEFYDRSGNAQIRLWWYRESSPQITP
jgi:hypothetical protein